MAMKPDQHGEPRRVVQVTCAQLDGRDRDPDARLRQARDAVAQHRRTRTNDGVESLVVLPELWPVGFFHFRDYTAAAQGLDGEVVTTIREAAREHQVWVLGGSFIERSPAGLHNTAFLVDPEGELVLTYRKVHLFGYRSAEADLLVAGDETRCADTPWGRVGVMTCYDLRFPELARRLTVDGAEILLVVSAWPAPRIEHWRILLRARAVENQVWVAAANTAGSDAGTVLGGHSAVVAPDGAVVAEAGSTEQFLAATVDAGQTTRNRTEFPFLRDRRFGVHRLSNDSAASSIVDSSSST